MMSLRPLPTALTRVLKHTCSLLLLTITATVHAQGGAVIQLPNTVTPNNHQNAPDYTEQRELFLKAEYAANQSLTDEYHLLLNKLEGYPLRPYVELSYLKNHTYLSNKKAIHQFLEKYANTALDWPLRKKWLQYLAKKKQAALFLADYQQTNDDELQCFQLRFALEQNPTDKSLLAKIDDLWLAGKSQPKACDSLFELWQKAGYRSADKIWQRLVLAATKGDRSLIPYLKRISPEKDQYLADLWLKTRRNPATVSHLASFPNRDPREKEILSYGIKRLVWRDNDKAISSWQEIQQKFEFTDQEKMAVTKVFALRLAKAQHKDANQWLDKVPSDQLDDDLIQWRIANGLLQGDWIGVLSVLQSLPKDLAEKESWLYWLARSLEKTNAPEDARIFFEKVAIERHYYGFLAATILGIQPNLAHDPLVFSDQELAAIDQQPAAQRALEFRALSRFTDARREWNSFNEALNRREKLAAAKWANLHGWYSRAIFTLPQQGYWDDVDLRFPLAYQSLIEQHSQRNKFEAAFTLAIARRESSFMSDAYSPAGAFGLMQMMPTTAKFIAKKHVNNGKLMTPETNIKLGTDYFRYLLKLTHGNEVLATASYNAGMHRVKKWTKLDKPIPVDIWIENIPFTETRDYVKSVLAYRQIYANLLGDQQNKFESLKTMEIGE